MTRYFNMSSTATVFYDYAPLVDSIQDGNEAEANRLLAEVVPKLIEYLIYGLGAKKEAAEDCAQQTVLKVLEQIKRKKIRQKSAIFSYLITTCRHEYLRHQRKEKRYIPDETVNDSEFEPAEQASRILYRERQQLLKKCINELDPESKEFIVHFLIYPDTTTAEAARHFKLSESNVRTRKSRITHDLHHALMQKLSRENLEFAE